MSSNTGITMTCKCNYSWEYTGKKKHPGLIACPYCGNKKRLPL